MFGVWRDNYRYWHYFCIPSRDMDDTQAPTSDFGSQTRVDAISAQYGSRTSGRHVRTTQNLSSQPAAAQAVWCHLSLGSFRRKSPTPPPPGLAFAHTPSNSPRPALSTPRPPQPLMILLRAEYEF